MSINNLFFDSSALIAGIISANGAAHALLLLAEAEEIKIIISEQVVAETERSIARKIPRALPDFRETIRRSKPIIVPDPLFETVAQSKDWMTDPSDVPILLAAMQANVDYLVTLNRRHFMDDPGVRKHTNLRIGTPGDALIWVREQIAHSGDRS